MRLIHFAKIAFYIFSFFISKAVYSDKLQYHLTQVSSKKYLKIELEVSLDRSSKEVKFDIPSYFWGTDVKDQIKNIKLLTKNAQLSIDKKQNQLIINNFSGKKVKLQYELHSADDKAQHYAPKITNKNFSFLGCAALITPVNNNDQKHDVYFVWSGFKTPIFTNLGATKNNLIQGNISIKDLQNSFFITGDTCLVKNLQKIKIVIQGKLLTDEQIFITKLKQILKCQDQFFQNASVYQEYLFIIIDDAFNQNNGGVRLDNFNILFVSKKTPLDKMLHLSSHERLHKWFGAILKADHDNELKYKWFMEGFTDYYAYYLSYLSGAITFAEYLKSYNDCLQEYFSSPVSMADNAMIVKNYWNSGLLSKLAYLRGRIFAHELNCKIKQSTNDVKNLDDLVKTMIAKVYHDKQFFTDVLFIDSLKKIANINIEQLLKKQIYLGELKIKAPIFENKAFLSTKDIIVADYSFDFIKSFMTKRVVGVNKKSSAYTAGLRNDQKFIGSWLNTIGQITTIEIKNGDKSQEIQYIPETKVINIPQYLE
jgi:predicted metalloprotease with PDZ domain